MATYEGGMEIEQLAEERPDALAKIPVERADRGGRGQGRRDRRRREVPGRRPRPGDRRSCSSLWETFVAEDATLVEVNPLVKDGDRQGRRAGRQGVAGRQRRLPAPRPRRAARTSSAENPLEVQAKEKGLNYVKLDGQVGIIGNGAGLVMSTLDVVAYAGEEHGGVTPANFLDIGGGASAEVMANGLDIILHDPDVKSGVRQRVRRHHLLRRGRERHRRGAEDAR